MDQNRKKPDQNRKPHMPAVIEARTMLCEIPLDNGRGESRGVWLNRAARLLAITPSIAKGLYYQKKKRIDADTFLRTVVAAPNQPVSA